VYQTVTVERFQAVQNGMGELAHEVNGKTAKLIPLRHLHIPPAWTFSRRTEMYAGRVTCCSPLVSQFEYVPYARRINKRWHRQTDTGPMH